MRVQLLSWSLLLQECMRAAVPACHICCLGLAQWLCGSPGFLFIWTSYSHLVIGESLFEFQNSCLDHSVDPFVLGPCYCKAMCFRSQPHSCHAYSLWDTRDTHPAHISPTLMLEMHISAMLREATLLSHMYHSLPISINRADCFHSVMGPTGIGKTQSFLMVRSFCLFLMYVVGVIVSLAYPCYLLHHVLLDKAMV